MIIRLFPQRRDDELVLEVNDDILTINGDDLDFSSVPNGATVPSEDITHPFIFGDVERSDGEIHIALIFPIGPEPSRAQAFPELIVVTENGPVKLPE